MKNICKARLLFGLIIISSFLRADIALPGLPKSTDKIFVGIVESRKKLLEKAKHERELMEKAREEQTPILRNLIEESKTQIGILDKQILQKQQDDFLQKKLITINESYQVFKDIQRERDRVIDTLDSLIKMLQEYLQDSDFNSVRKENKLTERLFYSFEDLQRVYNLVLDQEKKVALLSDQEKHIAVELDNRQRAVAATKEVFAVKKEEIEAGKGWLEVLSAQQIQELLSLEERLFEYKKILEGLRVKQSEYMSELNGLQLSHAKQYLVIFKDYLRLIKPAVRVNDTDIAQAKEALAKATIANRNSNEKLRSDIDRLRSLESRIEQELEDLSKSYNVSLGQDLQDWSRDVAKTADGYLGYCEVGLLKAQLMTYERKREALEYQIELNDEKIKDEALLLKVKETYHKKFSTEEEISQELKLYERPRVESQAALGRYKEKMNVVADALNTEKRVVDNISALRTQIEKQKETAFRSRSTDYYRCLDLLRRAEALEKERIDIFSKLTGLYSGLTSVINNKLRIIGFITTDLESRTIWYRPEYAISWDGIKNSFSDLSSFTSYVQAYFTRSNIVSSIASIWNKFNDSLNLLLFLLKILAVCGMLFLIKRILLQLITLCSGLGDASQGIMRAVAYLVEGFLRFVNTYYFALSVWTVCLSGIIFYDSPDSYVYIVLYLFSIPYFIYIANRFIWFMSQFNKEHNYPFLAADFERRFFIIFSLVLYATSTIVFFREAFMLTQNYRSELPNILFAINFSIFQIAFILLLDAALAVYREDIESVVSTRSDFWQWIYKQIDRYYYLILLLFTVIMIMINPYVGFGRLVAYLLISITYSIVLLLGLIWLHGLFKRTSSQLFFIQVDDMARERFTNAKTWFGIVIIASFLTLSFFGLVVGAKVWGWPVTLSKIMEIINYPIIGGDTDNAITFASLFSVLLFVCIGFMLAYGVNKFVLDRIFDLLLVDSGVQHTVTSIVQYFIIIVSVFLGFQNARLGGLVNYIFGGLILGLGWVLKEPISDFVAYFIILVQRPIKIGDFIKIDSEITGVVRKITARAVILRRKNSMTLVVPNAFLISKTIINWNYTRNFIAFDDIFIDVDYREDIDKIREVLYSVVDSHPNVLKNPKPWVRLENFGEHGYHMMIRGFISSVYTLEKWEIASTIRVNIVKAFAKEGIQLAMPTRLLITRADTKTTQSLEQQGFEDK